ncbi:hypothetical protein ENH_00042790 [Eimeria necatrix]|uniref:Uncharacterized protein n=1 Tax=Eimeria necatrix TaxID=51315 RepID=U6MGR3_9EIME|nr:hypothetical protein ENH_00042790 [Eimeria necatrix]CDJ63442.1 hypothetical protein ENH_00042790 [Eimeria necatrix]
MSVSKVPSGTLAPHRHATPKPTVAERLYGHKEAPSQLVPIANVTGMPGDSPSVTWDQFHSVMVVIRTVIGGSRESGAAFPILPEDGSTVQAFLLRMERRFTQMQLEGPMITVYLRRIPLK